MKTKDVEVRVVEECVTRVTFSQQRPVIAPCLRPLIDVSFLKAWPCLKKISFSWTE